MKEIHQRDLFSETEEENTPRNKPGDDDDRDDKDEPKDDDDDDPAARPKKKGKRPLSPDENDRVSKSIYDLDFTIRMKQLWKDHLASKKKKKGSE